MTGADQRSSQTSHYNFTIQNILSAHERELYELAQISGITINPHVFKILLELLQTDVSPAAVFTMLQNMSGQHPSTKAGVGGSKKVVLSKSSSQPTGKKKPPIAAKPKRTSSENH